MSLPNVITAVAIAAIGAGATVAQGRRRTGARERIKADIEIYNALPDSSSQKVTLLESIDRQISGVVTRETAVSRDPSGTVIALVLLLAGIATTSLVVNAGGAWQFFLIGTIFLLVFGIVGLGESIPKAIRDEKGNKIKK